MKSKEIMLIVDDIEINRQILADLFQNDYVVIYACDGLEAIKKIEKHSNQLAIVLLDMVMPNMDGIAVLKWMNENAYNNIPVVAITAEEEYQLTALQNGAWDFISKPMENEIIRARIDNVLGRYALKKEKKLTQQLSYERQEMHHLVNSIPGGIAIYKIIENRFETVYFSDGVAKLTGHSRAEYAKRVGSDAASILYKEDKERVLASATEAIKNGSAVDETYRIYHKDGSLVWVRLNGVLIGEEDGAPLMHAVFQKPQRMAQLYDNLVNESKDAIYASDINNYDLLYVNKSGLNMVGKTATDYSRKKCYEFLFNRTSPCSFCKIDKMNTVSYLERDFIYTHNNKIYSLRGKLTDWNGLAAHVEYVQDVTEIRQAAQNNANFLQQLQEILYNIPGGMCVYRVDSRGIMPIIHNKAFFDIFGYSAEHQKQVENKTNYLNVHPDDLDGLQSEIYTAIKNCGKINYTYRMFNDSKNRYIWVNMNAVVVLRVNGEKFCYVNYSDVTQEREAQEALISAQKDLQKLKNQAQTALENYMMLVNAVPGGIAQYEIKGEKIVTSFFSDGLCKLTGRTHDERNGLNNGDILSVTYDEDLPVLEEAIKKAIINKENISLTYRVKTKDDKPLWVHLNAAYSCGPNGEILYHAVFSDIDKLKKIEQELQENQVRYSTAIKSSGINVWEYDIQKDSLYVISNSSRIKQNCYYIDDYSKSTVKNGFVREDSVQLFLSIFERLRQGEKEVTEDIWYKTTDKAGWWCERVTYTTIFDSTGVPVKAYGAGRDVTREKDAEKKFYEEISCRKAIPSNAISSIIVDLTMNRVLDISSGFKSVCSLAKVSADKYFAETATRIVDEKMRKSFAGLFNRKGLLNRFSSGEYIVTYEFARTFDDTKVYWICYSVHLIQNPNTKNIIANISCVDVTNDKVMQSIMNTVAKTDYDFFVVVDGSVNSARDYAVTDGSRLYDEFKPFEEQNEKLVRGCVCENDVERVIEECKIDNVWSHVKNGQPHKFSFSMRDRNGEIRRKQIQFSHIDTKRKAYLMSRIDVNDIYELQEKAKRQLEKALAAKSDFLSNMSHDMRTPMNAIIGFSQMATEQDATKEELLDYMSKINKSGTYLLNLINDVLDMTKIENNKIELNPSPVDFSELFSGIISSVKPMMDEKNIAFTFETRNFIKDKSAVLDKIRMQQIFINLLSNATKFTPQGGKIECIMESLEFDGKFSRERTIIRDNGCGMSKAFLKKACLPFEQEHSSTPARYGGTGLGLSIVKNLVEHMGGTLTINSTLGVGTEVVLDFTVELIDKPLEMSSSKSSQENNFSFAGKRILLCEDHPLNCEIASKLLAKKGLSVDVANNGEVGLEKFKNSPEYYYSAILMDIRMPVMDGLQATAEIRKLKRSDAKGVPIIAMTANAFDDDVKKSLASGMNAHLAKPVEPQTLYKTLEATIKE